jgi:hypothetical protein
MGGVSTARDETVPPSTDGSVRAGWQAAQTEVYATSKSEKQIPRFAGMTIQKKEGGASPSPTGIGDGFGEK